MFLELQDIRKSYGKDDYKVEVLKGINLQIEKGEFVVMLGPSGSGKSTLLNIIGGIDSADSGQILIEGNGLNHYSRKQMEKYRRQHLGYIFQMYNLIPNLTVRENIETGAFLSKKPLEIDPLIEVLGLSDHAGKLPNQISGGQQQRISIGRAIVKNPDLLLCDEPTGALDYATSKQIMELIEKINQEYAMTIIMVTHNDAFKDMADHVIRLRDGEIRKSYYNETKAKAKDLEW